MRSVFEHVECSLIILTEDQSWKLHIPNNCIHQHDPKQSPIIFFHYFMISFCTELHGTCRKQKEQKLPTFSACLPHANQRSQRQ